MKPSKWKVIEKDENFISAFRQAVTCVIGEYVKEYTEKDESGNYKVNPMSLNAFDNQRRRWCMDLAQNGNDVTGQLLLTIRALFDPMNDDDDVAYITDQVDIDATFLILYQKIKGSDIVNVWAGARPEMI
jgi:hypothetical protein